MRTQTNRRQETDQDYLEYEQDLAQATYEQEVAQIEEGVKLELRVRLEEDQQVDPSLVDLEQQIAATREDALTTAAKAAYLKKLKEGKQAKTVIGRIKAKVRGKIAPALLGLGVTVAIAPIPTEIVYRQYENNKEETARQARESAAIDEFYRDGKDSKLEPAEKTRIAAIEEKHYSIENRHFTDEFKRETVRADEWSGANLFQYILDGKYYNRYNFGYNQNNFPRYKFDISRLENPLTMEQMERALDVYQNILPDTLASTIRDTDRATPYDVQYVRTYMLRSMVKPFLTSEAAKGELSPAVKDFSDKLRNILGQEYNAWVDDLLKKKS